MIAIVDYNMGNLASVKNAFMFNNHKIVVESDPDKLKYYDKIILPGVGAFGDAMEHLKQRDMDLALKDYAKSGNYMLGVCLGMQLLFDSSSEFGQNDGLGLIKGKIQAFDKSKFSQPLKVPHMGWNKLLTQEHKLFDSLDESHYLYFVHSYHAVAQNRDDVIAQSEYGYKFDAAVAHNNILGIQPHPEKSHKNGLQIIENFIRI